MNREVIIEQIVEAYLNSIYEAEAEVWIANVLMFGHKNKPFCEMDDDELLKAHREWCEDLYEEGL